MAHIGIFYGSTSGNTQEVAEKIAQQLGIADADVHDVSKAKADFAPYDVVLFGSSTMGYGDLQDDWDDFADKVKAADLNGKKIALFGCGDSASYSDTFCDALGKIYNDIKNKGCQVIGRVSTEGYTYDGSEAIVDGQFIGLPIDNDNESEQTDQRIACWIDDLKKAI